MAFVAMLRKMLKDPEIGKLVVPIVPDEARTFGMESLFRTVGIYSSVGQKYEPVDVNTLLYYKEAKDGQILPASVIPSSRICPSYAALLQGSEGRADPGRGNYGSGLDGVVHRGGFGVCDPRNQYDSVFHLLLDVRFPADCGFHLGRGGYAHARIFAGRHVGAHNAFGRRFEASGRQ